MCKTKFTDEYGNRTGFGILGDKVGKAVDLSTSPPKDRLEEEQEENNLKNMNVTFCAASRPTLFTSAHTDTGQQRYETVAKSGLRKKYVGLSDK